MIPIIDKYFKDCDDKIQVYKNDKGLTKIVYEPYTVSGLCLALDMTRETLLEYEALTEFSDTIKKAKQKIENWIEKRSLAGDLNPSVSIFNLKNNFGWKDTQVKEIANADGKPFKTESSAEMSDDELEKKILELTNKNKK